MNSKLSVLVMAVVLAGCGSKTSKWSDGQTDSLANGLAQETVEVKYATGFSVRLGTSERLHAKLRSLLLTEAELVGRGYASGSIDVSSPEKPTYIP